jgi:hypothetical protein
LNKKAMSDERDESTELDLDEPYVPKTSGWPMWDLEAEKILSGIRHWVQTGNEEESDVAFNHDFLRILDAFLLQLINWIEQTDLPEVHEWAGRALADRLQFLWTQKGDWHSENEAFNKRWKEFADRRHARSPRSYLGWLAGDCLRKLAHQRILAGVLLSSYETAKKSASGAEMAELKERISQVKELIALPAFSPESALRWAEVVFERMQQAEQGILNSPVLQKCQTRDSRERRPTGRVRLYDFKKTIIGAVVRLASKAPGHIRGITRPPY